MIILAHDWTGILPLDALLPVLIVVLGMGPFAALGLYLRWLWSDRTPSSTSTWTSMPVQALDQRHQAAVDALARDVRSMNGNTAAAAEAAEFSTWKTARTARLKKFYADIGYGPGAT